jgi:glucose/arabinose dehydrogenase
MHAIISLTRLSPAVLSLALAACGGGEPAPAAPAEPPAAAAPAAPAPAAPAPAAPAAAVSDRVDDPTFELALKPTGPYAPGKVQSFAVSLKPRGEYHVNQDYPFSVSLTGQGVTFPKAELSKSDAAKFDDYAVELDVPFSAPSAGKHTVSALVKFAVCTPETCVPDERTLALALPVE